MSQAYMKYNVARSYEWNYENAPEFPAQNDASIERVPAQSSWTFCGLPVDSPIGIAAGPLLNSRWLLHYANLGYEVLTYKTVRSRLRTCYSQPNLQPIRESQVATGMLTHASQEMSGSWAISFGMPSQPPEVWQEDVAFARELLPPGKILSVSVVASADPDWTLQQVADDYAICAEQAAKSGADSVELNFSCPNVASVDGQLYQDPASARVVLDTVRSKVPDIPLLIKIGLINSEARVADLYEATSDYLTAYAMTNCIACHVQGEDSAPLFNGEMRGIGGQAIREASISQVGQFKNVMGESPKASLIGVGGVSSAEHVASYIEAGAECVQLATAAMLEPELGRRIQRALQSS